MQTPFQTTEPDHSVVTSHTSYISIKPGLDKANREVGQRRDRLGENPVLRAMSSKPWGSCKEAGMVRPWQTLLCT